MLRLSLITILFTLNAFAIDVLVSKNSIKFEEKLNPSHLRLMKISSLKKACVPVTLSQIQNNEYVTTHYINKNSIICQKDLKTYSDNSVLFNFGSLQIEKKGKIVFENKQFIRIKRDDGKIEKIYKDGRLK